MSVLGKKVAEAVIDAWLYVDRSPGEPLPSIAAADAAIAPLVEAARVLANVVDSKLSTARETVEAVQNLRAILYRATGEA